MKIWSRSMLAALFILLSFSFTPVRAAEGENMTHGEIALALANRLQVGKAAITDPLKAFQWLSARGIKTFYGWGYSDAAKTTFDPKTVCTVADLAMAMVAALGLSDEVEGDRSSPLPYLELLKREGITLESGEEALAKIEPRLLKTETPSSDVDTKNAPAAGEHSLLEAVTLVVQGAGINTAGLSQADANAIAVALLTPVAAPQARRAVQQVGNTGAGNTGGGNTNPTS